MTARSATVATAAIGPWGDELGAFERWIAGGETASAQVREPAGFIASRFSPLVYTAASRCLDAAGAELDPARTGVVLCSVLGDTTTADVASQNLAEGRVHNPLLFYQSVPTSILGYLGRERGIRGPLACVSAGADAAERARELAAFMLAADDADAVLVLYVELKLDERSRRVHHALRGGPLGELGCADDVVVCLLLRRVGDSHSNEPGEDDEMTTTFDDETTARSDETTARSDETTATSSDETIDLPATESTRRLGIAARRFLAWALRESPSAARSEPAPQSEPAAQAVPTVSDPVPVFAAGRPA